MKMREERVLDIMLDLEFLGTEEDMIREYPGEDAFPIVTSIGLVAQLNGEIKFSRNFALNFTEQTTNGAKFGKRCMLEFWTKEPLLGQELARTMAQEQEISRTLAEISIFIDTFRTSMEPTKVNILGNSLLADNAKVVRLFAKYAFTELPWTYFENTDYREYLKVASYLGFDKKESELNFVAKVQLGTYAHLGHPVVALHNAEFDCIKQLNTLNDAREYLTKVKEQVVCLM